MSADDAMRRFGEWTGSKVWDGLLLAGTVDASVTRATEAMASSSEPVVAFGRLTSAMGETLAASSVRIPPALAGSVGTIATTFGPLFDAKASALGTAAVRFGEPVSLGLALAVSAPALKAAPWNRLASLGELHRADRVLAQAVEALEAFDASVRLDESSERVAWQDAHFACATQMADRHPTADSAFASLVRACFEHPVPDLSAFYFEREPSETQAERRERMQRRAVWIVLRLARRRIRDEVRRRLRAMQTDDRLDACIVVAQIAYFLTHGCHPPALRRSAAIFPGRHLHLLS